MRYFLVLLAVSVAASGQAKKHTHAKTQKAHDHGAAEINFAIEGKTGEIEFHAPAMGIVGFEYIPKTAADKKKQADALAKLKASFPQMVILDASLGCKITPKSVEVEQEEADHAAIDADFAVACNQPLGGSKVSFAVTKAYPSLTSVKVQAVGAGGSTGVEIRSDKGVLTLPR